MKHTTIIDCDIANILVDSTGNLIFDAPKPFDHIIKFDLIQSAYIRQDKVLPLSSVGYWTEDWKYHPPRDGHRFFNDWDHHFED